jgi:hypothetical protein
MTQDEIEEMAELSGLYLYKTNEELIYCLTYFANLVAQKEREACAKIADEWTVAYPHPSKTIAELIRKRGKE